MTVKTKIWMIVPAAGVGKRVGAKIPKQYLTLNDSTIVEITLQKLAQISDIEGIVVAVNDDDGFWSDQRLPENIKIIRVSGGKERSDSVANALNWLAENENPEWVMVHDVARPCIDLQDIEKLKAQCIEKNKGGILAVPASDTLKFTLNAKTINKTIDRAQIWQALTPQMFIFKSLHTRLNQLLYTNEIITDEASVMEYFDEQPMLIEGRRDNIKITRPEDLRLAELYLQDDSLFVQKEQSEKKI
jgi:2-C-methyl-D-erythritol 4-phosphate cytidylyltransferase